MVDVVIEAAGEIGAINLTVDLVKEEGHILQFGVPRAIQVPYNYRQLFFKRVSLQTMVHATREPGHTSTQMALALICSAPVTRDPLRL